MASFFTRCSGLSQLSLASGILSPKDVTFNEIFSQLNTLENPLQVRNLGLPGVVVVPGDMRKYIEHLRYLEFLNKTRYIEGRVIVHRQYLSKKIIDGCCTRPPPNLILDFLFWFNPVEKFHRTWRASCGFIYYGPRIQRDFAKTSRDIGNSGSFLE